MEQCVCGGEIYSWCLYQQGARSVPPSWMSRRWRACRTLGASETPHDTSHYLNGKHARAGENAKGYQSSTECNYWTSQKHTPQTNEQCSNDVEPGFKFCLCKDLASTPGENDERGTMLITHFVCRENALWAGTSTNFSFIIEKFLAHPYFLLRSRMLPPAGQDRPIILYVHLDVSIPPAHPGSVWTPTAVCSGKIGTCAALLLKKCFSFLSLITLQEQTL